jgi:hypothetical protein
MLKYPHTRQGLMRSPAHLLRRQIAISLVAFLALPFAGSLPAVGQQAASTQQEGAMPPPPTPSHNDTQPPGPGQSPSDNQPPNAPPAQQSGTPAPVGTAAAPYEKGIGVAASRPAGAVIAPAKQKRTRSLLIKVGVLIGAAVAVGTVVGLSSASPSRPH